MWRSRADRPMMCGPIACGFMLAELLLVLALLAGIATMTMPALGHWLIRDIVDTQARALLAMFSYARSEAIKRGVRMIVCRYDDLGHCNAGAQVCMQMRVAANDWACGYAAFVALPRSATTTPDNMQRMLRVQLPNKNVMIQGGVTRLSFTPPAGQIIGGFRSFDISARSAASSNDDKLHRCVHIAASGRARMVNGPC